jgi:adenylate cyclase
MARPESSLQLSSSDMNDHGVHTVLVVDDVPTNVKILVAHLEAKGFKTLAAYNGEEAMTMALKHMPDLVMLDVNMPVKNGLEACEELKQNPETMMLPIILVTANSDTNEIVKGFEVGADDYLIKPYNYMEMLARVRSMVRIKDTQAMLLEVNRHIDDLNHDLEAKVKEQVKELERVNRLRRFFSPQIVDSIVSDGAEDILKEHRREITVVFLDLRHFTSFAETASPNEVISTIRELQACVGPVIFRHRGTLERFTGDGMMVFLGDPEPMVDHPLQSVKMSIAIQKEVDLCLRESWAAKGYDLALGIGMATGVASLGTIGFEGRLDYAAIGSVTNLAARLSSRAEGGQILLSARTNEMVESACPTNAVGEVELKGFSHSQALYEVSPDVQLEAIG